jgi:glutathione S-transferase
MIWFRRLMKHEASERQRASLIEELQRWEGYLADHTWLSGDALGLADLCVLGYVSVAARVGLDLAALPRLDTLRKRFEARDSLGAAWPKTWAR